MVSEPVKPYFTRLLRVLTFCLGASKIVILKENGVENGVVKGELCGDVLIILDRFETVLRFFKKVKC